MWNNFRHKGYVLFEAMIGLVIATSIVMLLSIIIGTLTREHIDRARKIDQYANALMELRSQDYFVKMNEDTTKKQLADAKENEKDPKIDLDKHTVQQVEVSEEVTIVANQYQLQGVIPDQVLIGDQGNEGVIVIESISYQTTRLYDD